MSFLNDFRLFLIIFKIYFSVKLFSTMDKNINGLLATNGIHDPSQISAESYKNYDFEEAMLKILVYIEDSFILGGFPEGYWPITVEHKIQKYEIEKWRRIFTWREYTQALGSIF